MGGFNEHKQLAIDWIDDNQARFSEHHLKIWNFAETAWREYKSSQTYVDLLRAEGFEVEQGSGGMPTAFSARWGKGDPVIGTLAEYDAVPGNSQEAVPYRSPRKGLHPWAPGHTDPHSSLGTTALAGILATKAVMERFGIPGTLRLFGEPAEKVCGSKAIHAAKGYFDGIDAFVLYHPKWTNTILRDMQYGSYWSVVFTFENTEPESWIDASLAPSVHQHGNARAPGAVDALCLMYTNTKYTKEAMFPHTGLWSLNEFILAGGDATSDNMSPRFSQIQYSWRSPTLDIQQQIFNVLKNNARHAAGVAGCTVSVRWVAKTRTGIVNHSLADAAYENIKLVGPSRFDETAREFARKIQENLGFKPMDNPILDECEQVMPPDEYDGRIRRAMPAWQTNFAADDYVEYTWHAPTCRIFSTVPVLKPPKKGYSYPAWVSNAMTGIPALIDPGIWVGSKTMATTMIDLLTQPSVLENARAEFVERTGGGVGGTKWVAPLLPKDFDPPIDLRWPEYVDTFRGHEWTLPTPLTGSGAGERI